jgi:membrane protein implicated in regulation of membrane protease activity
MNFFDPEIKIFPQPVKGGIVEKAIAFDQIGRVYWQATSWPARFHGDFQTVCQPGEQVIVLGMEGITLLICKKVF